MDTHWAVGILLRGYRFRGLRFRLRGLRLRLGNRLGLRLLGGKKRRGKCLPGEREEGIGGIGCPAHCVHAVGALRLNHPVRDSLHHCAGAVRVAGHGTLEEAVVHGGVVGLILAGDDLKGGNAPLLHGDGDCQLIAEGLPLIAAPAGGGVGAVYVFARLILRRVRLLNRGDGVFAGRILLCRILPASRRLVNRLACTLQNPSGAVGCAADAVNLCALGVDNAVAELLCPVQVGGGFSCCVKERYLCNAPFLHGDLYRDVAAKALSGACVHAVLHPIGGLCRFLL